MNVIKRKPPNAGIPKKKGTKNKITRAAKEAFQMAFDGIGGVPALIEWGKKNRKHFYTLYSRLIAVQGPSSPLVAINIPIGQPITDPAEAARVYAEIMGNPNADLSGITFASPAPSTVVAEVPAALPAPVEPIVAESNAAPLPDPMAERIAPVEPSRSNWDRPPEPAPRLAAQIKEGIFEQRKREARERAERVEQNRREGEARVEAQNEAARAAQRIRQQREAGEL